MKKKLLAAAAGLIAAPVLGLGVAHADDGAITQRALTRASTPTIATSSSTRLQRLTPAIWQLETAIW